MAGTKRKRAETANIQPSIDATPHKEQLSLIALPVEIIQGIGLYLPAHKDFVNLQRASEAFHNVLKDDFLWGERFRNSFDIPKGRPIHKDEQGRQDLASFKGMCRTLNWSRTTVDQDGILLTTRGLFAASAVLLFSSYSHLGSVSSNVVQLERLARKHRFFNHISPDLTRLSNRLNLDWELGPTAQKFPLSTLILALMHVGLAPGTSSKDLSLTNFFDSQTIVYDHADYQNFFYRTANDVILSYRGVNVLLHFVNFWLYHLCDDQTSVFSTYFRALPTDMRPTAWKEKIPNEQPYPIGKCWMGVSARLDDYRKVNVLRQVAQGLMPSHPPQIFMDVFDEDHIPGGFQLLELKFIPPGKQRFWPGCFDMELPLNPSAAAAYGYDDMAGGYETTWNPSSNNLPMIGKLYGAANGLISGNLSHVPVPGDLKLGFQRISFASYPTDGTEDTILEEVNAKKVWCQSTFAHEGIVLPGGRIMIGRWFYPDHLANVDAPMEDVRLQTYLNTGPFLYWCVDE